MESSQSPPPPPCRLLALPPELCLEILDTVFPIQQCDLAVFRSHRIACKDPRGRRGGVALLQTCRQLYNEGISVLYNNTDFRVHVFDRYKSEDIEVRWFTLKLLDAFRKSLCTQQIKSLSIVIDYDLELYATCRPEDRRCGNLPHLAMLLKTLPADATLKELYIFPHNNRHLQEEMPYWL